MTKIKSFDWFYYSRYSSLILNLEERFSQEIAENKKAEKNLYKPIFSSSLNSSELVFDIGASQGYTASVFLDYNAKVICIEPDGFNLKCLKARFNENPNIQVLEKAISNKSGKAVIHIQDRGTTLHTLNQKWKDSLESESNKNSSTAVSFSQQKEIETTTLDHLISIYGKPFFIKIDVEGHEKEVLEGLTQAVPFLCFEANLPEFLEETIECIIHLNKLAPNCTFNYSTYNQFILESNISADHFIAFLKTTELTYLDIFCRSKF